MRSKAGFRDRCAKCENRVLGKLGLDTREQKADTNYMDGIQGLLSAKWSAAESEHPWQLISGETGENQSLRSGAETRR